MIESKCLLAREPAILHAECLASFFFFFFSLFLSTSGIILAVSVETSVIKRKRFVRRARLSPYISSKWNDDTPGTMCLSGYLRIQTSQRKNLESLAKKNNQHHSKDITLFITDVAAKISLTLNSFNTHFV